MSPLRVLGLALLNAAHGWLLSAHGERLRWSHAAAAASASEVEECLRAYDLIRPLVETDVYLQEALSRMRGGVALAEAVYLAVGLCLRCGPGSCCFGDDMEMRIDCPGRVLP
jgi:hypothetical protein